MVDNAVTWFGVTIENALGERVKTTTVRGETTYKPKYTLTRLLSPHFRLPRPLPDPEEQLALNPFAPLMVHIGRPGSGVKMWKYVPPEPDKEM